MPSIAGVSSTHFVGLPSPVLEGQSVGSISFAYLSSPIPVSTLFPKALLRRLASWPGHAFEVGPGPGGSCNPPYMASYDEQTRAIIISVTAGEVVVAAKFFLNANGAVTHLGVAPAPIGALGVFLHGAEWASALMTGATNTMFDNLPGVYELPPSAFDRFSI